MNLFLDCEFNGFNGPLISMALVDEQGHYFYQVLSCPTPIPWVAENVMPRLNQSAVSRKHFQYALHDFLSQYDQIHIIADWPEDIALFLNILSIAPGSHMSTPPLSMEIWKSLSTHSLIQSSQPHNALADAKALAQNYHKVKSHHPALK